MRCLKIAKRALCKMLAVTMIASSLGVGALQTADAAVITQIPNTTRSFKEYDKSLMSLTGYAKGYITDKTEYVGTSYYRTVSNELEFLQALSDAKGGAVKVIEITSDLNLGYYELTEEARKYVTKYEDPYTSYTNPTLKETGASKLTFPQTDGLTIFSKNGNTIKHVEFKINKGSNNIAIRNLNFDDMWQWDDTGNHKEVGWTYIKINGGNNIWLDHCSFSLGADGLVDIENGSKNVTMSWCTFGLPTTETPGTDSMMYKTIMYMESLYQAGKCSTTGRYYKMRQAGSTPEMIMAYEAVHSKVHLLGGGDKDYKDDEIANVENGNQNFRLTLAYNKYTNVMQRVPLVRQGTAHMFNCYIDDSGHSSYAKKYSTQTKAGNMNMTRAINARSGACIAADTCVFNGLDQPIIGVEKACDDASSYSSPWNTLFSETYNHVLIVNSKTTNTSGATYTGSSWDNNGENLFTAGLTWYDKSTIGNWAWSSEIVDVDKYSKQNYPGKNGSAVTPFEIQYNYDEKLPYSYECLPLEDVTSVLNQYSGSGKVTMSANDWLKVSYENESEATVVDGKYALTVEKGGKAQVEVGTSEKLYTLELKLDTSSDFTLHVNIGYWAAYGNITCKNGTLKSSDLTNISDVVINGDTAKLYFGEGVYADNVSNTNNKTQMSYRGKISLHHNSGNDAIGVVAYNINGNGYVTGSGTTESYIPFSGKLYIAGDSIAAGIDGTEAVGWGNVIGNYYGSDLTVKNEAHAGDSLLSFYYDYDGDGDSDGRWRNVYNYLTENDYVIISFGHNDQNTAANRYASATASTSEVGSFKWRLKNHYIDPALKVGATPILMTPVVRCSYTNGSFVETSTHLAYGQAMRDLVAEYAEEGIDIILIDAQKYSYDEYSKMTYDEASNLHARWSDGTLDTTHYNSTGAAWMAEYVCKELQEHNLGINDYLSGSSSTATAAPTVAPTATPTAAPTAVPTATPTAAPTATPETTGSVLTVEKGSKAQIKVDKTKQIKTLTLKFDTSTDFVAHVNVGYWAAYGNVTCKNGKLSASDLTNIESASVSGNAITLTFKSGIYADNVKNTNNATQMSYQGYISIHHNSGNYAIDVVSYQINDETAIDGYAVKVAKGSKEQIQVGIDNALESVVLKLDTSTDYVLHVNVGYWKSYLNISCSNGTLTASDLTNVKGVTVNGNTVTITFNDGTYADNVKNTSNSTQMSYRGKISLHHNSGNEAIAVISYDVNYK